MRGDVADAADVPVPRCGPPRIAGLDGDLRVTALELLALLDQALDAVDGVPDLGVGPPEWLGST